jgi:hypothetical protein
MFVFFLLSPTGFQVIFRFTHNVRIQTVSKLTSWTIWCSNLHTLLQLWLFALHLLLNWSYILSLLLLLVGWTYFISSSESSMFLSVALCHMVYNLPRWHCLHYLTTISFNTRTSTNSWNILKFLHEFFWRWAARAGKLSWWFVCGLSS